MIDILNYTLPELESLIVEQFHEPSFRARQVWLWLWRKNADSFEEMSDLSKSFRQKLIEQASINKPKIITTQESSDGTIKFLLELHDQNTIETVLIPSLSKTLDKRMTQCISTQVGCPMACTFCSTGSMGFVRNLNMSEILAQLQYARNYLGDNNPDHPLIRNLVYMGMGEPLLNLNEVQRSLQVLSEPKALHFSTRRITISTSGVKNKLDDFAKTKGAYLAVSLHAPNQELRELIMPNAAKWQLDELLESLAHYPLNPQEFITFEYLLLANVNDKVEHANELAKICLRLKAKVNLIVYNQSENSNYQAPSMQRVGEFQKILWNKGITAILRKSKGQDIKAACGQLRAEFS